MKFSRRQFLGAAPAVLCAQTARPAIDRRALVERHNPVLGAFDGRSPLSVGNGEFAFTADVTGLQTFPALYDRQMPLCTMSQWGWHTIPDPSGQGPSDFRLAMYDTYGRQVGYATSSAGQVPLFNWLRENPHRLHLGKIGFAIEKPGDVAATVQTLDLWTGTLRSEFQWSGQRVVVETACHPQLDLLAVTVRGRVPVTFEFPYGSGAMDAADWDHPEKHRSTETARGANRLDIARELDRDRYSVGIAWQTAGEMQREGPHRFVLRPAADRLEFVCEFREGRPGSRSTTHRRGNSAASREHWRQFWSGGGAVDLSGSRDPRAKELERRIVLSQYLDRHSVRRLAAAAGNRTHLQQLVRQIPPGNALLARRALRPVGPRAAAGAQPGLVRRHPALRARESAPAQGYPARAGRK